MKFNDYMSPINLVLEDMKTSIDDNIVRGVLNYGINVDKEELIKALKYDRGQYEKGFSDACSKFRDILIKEFGCPPDIVSCPHSDCDECWDEWIKEVMNG